MEAIAKARFQRISPRKARVVLNMVRGKNVAEALNELRFTTKAAAPIVAKAIGSAIANAKQKNEEVNLDSLVVKTAFADMAPESTSLWFPSRRRKDVEVQVVRGQELRQVAS
jgi:large subunit ribosomal protein L22